MAWLCGGRREYVLNSLISKGSVFFRVGGRARGSLAGGQLLREYSLNFGEAFAEG